MYSDNPLISVSCANGVLALGSGRGSEGGDRRGKTYVTRMLRVFTGWLVSHHDLFLKFKNSTYFRGIEKLQIVTVLALPYGKNRLFAGNVNILKQFSLSRLCEKGECCN